MKNQDVKLEDLGKILKVEEEEKKKGTDETDNSDEEKDKDSTEGEKKKKGEPEANPANEDADLELNEDTPEFIEQMGIVSYITFDEFAKIMSLFNPRTGIDEKIQCKFLFKSLIYQFISVFSM